MSLTYSSFKSKIRCSQVIWGEPSKRPSQMKSLLGFRSFCPHSLHGRYPHRKSHVIHLHIPTRPQKKGQQCKRNIIKTSIFSLTANEAWVTVSAVTQKRNGKLHPEYHHFLEDNWETNVNWAFKLFFWGEVKRERTPNSETPESSENWLFDPFRSSEAMGVTACRDLHIYLDWEVCSTSILHPDPLTATGK